MPVRSKRTCEADVRTVFRQRVNQNPIRLDVAVAAAGKISTQWMILVFRRQRLAVNQQFQHGLKLRHILTALVRAFDIFFELAGAAERPHKPKSA